MLYVALALGLAATLYFMPAYLSRQRRIDSLAEAHLAAHPTAPSIFTNASVAYAVQMATFVPFFLWAAGGEFLQILLNTLFFGLGLALLVLFRRPILAYLKEALSVSRNVTLHGFMSENHGGARSVQIVSALLTIVALCGIVISEVFYMSAVLQPLLGLKNEHLYLVMTVMLFGMFLYTTVGGNDGVQRADQFQLGVAYAALFASLGLLLAGTSGRLAAAVAGPVGFSILLVVVAILGLCWLRRGHFLDPSVRQIVDDELASHPTMMRVARIYRRIETALNFLIAFAVLVCLGSAAYAIALHDWSNGLPDLIAPALTTNLSFIALVALIVLPLLYQICDISNWQRLAALRPDIVDLKTPENDAMVRRSLLTYAIEAPIVWLILAVFGVIALAYVGPHDGDALAAFLGHLIAGGPIDLIILTLFVLAAFSIAISTMDAVMSAALYVFRSDVLVFTPLYRGASQQRLNWLTNLFGVGAYLFVVVALYLFDIYLDVSPEAYLPILIAFYAAQIAFLPFILAGIGNQKAGVRRYSISAGGALLALLLSFASAIGLTFWGLTGGPPDAAWWAIPVAITVSLLIFLIDFVRTRRKRPMQATSKADG